MAENELIPMISHESAAYRALFKHFLQHTDQKLQAKRWLTDVIDGLPRRNVFVDVGAGDGTLTREIASRFTRTVAIEPNPDICAELGRIPGVEVRPSALEGVEDILGADLVLCSHVFYLIEQSRWLDTVRRLTGWLSPSGSLVIGGQSRDSDCKDLGERFLGERRHLGSLAELKPALEAAGFSLSMHHVDSHIDTPDFPSAMKIAEFVLNRSGRAQGLPRGEVEQFVRHHFVQPSGGYRLSCHQDFYWVHRKA